MSVTGYLGLLTRQVMSEDFSKCYNDVNICLWTNGSKLRESEAQSACEVRNSFLPRVTNSNIHFKMAEFRAAAGDLVAYNGFWIAVKAVGLNYWQWVDGSSFAS